MKCLLDTHAFLWAALDPKKLSREAQAVIEDSDNQLFLSAASLWEIGILESLRRVQLKLSIQEMAALSADKLGSSLLEIEPDHIDRMRRLPFHHRDPFDRLLIGQALHLRATVVGKDRSFDAYGVERIW